MVAGSPPIALQRSINSSELLTHYIHTFSDIMKADRRDSMSSHLRVTKAAMVLMPSPDPSITPAPMAKGFFKLPPKHTGQTNIGNKKIS